MEFNRVARYLGKSVAIVRNTEIATIMYGVIYGFDIASKTFEDRPTMVKLVGNDNSLIGTDIRDIVKIVETKELET